MTSKLTREERVQALYDLKVGQVLSLADIENVKMLSRMALAAMDSEPVAVIDKEGNPMTRDECNDDRVFAICCKVGTPLYTHPAPSIPSAVTWCPKCNDTGLADSGGVQPWGEPILIECDCRTEPAPVAVPDEVFNAAYEQHLNGVLCGDNNKQAALSFLNACRAAMLQASPVCTCPGGDGSLRWPCPSHPGSSPAIPDGYVMVPREPTDEMIAAAMNCEDVLFNSDDSFCVQFGNIYEAMLAAAPQSPGNEPATVPGKWIPVSERMPEAGGDMIVFADGIVMSGVSYAKKKGFYIQALEYDDDEPVDSVTHWMPLPAAPQEVKGE